MKVYNQDKTQILNEYDLEKGYLISDKILVDTLPAQEEIKEQGHYETVNEYENGGKDVKWVVDVEGHIARPETPVYDDIQVYIPYTEEEIIERLRYRREEECFSIINRGQLWYNNLTAEQYDALQVWYKTWLDVTETKMIPEKPNWLK